MRINEPGDGGSGKIKLAVVEDDNATQQSLQTLLKNDYEVLIIPRGDVAVDAIRQFSPAVVILDIHLPGLNGFEVCTALRSKDDLKKLPVIFLTSRQDSWSKMYSKEAGGDFYVAKPFGKDEMLATIKEALAGK